MISISEKEIIELAVSASWLIPLTTALVEVVKRTIQRDITRWVPIISILFGIASSLVVVSNSPIGVVIGLMVGLSACGLYEVGKTTIVGK